MLYPKELSQYATVHVDTRNELKMPSTTEENIAEEVTYPKYYQIDGISPAVLAKLFSVSAEAKIWGVAAKSLNQANPPRYYPEYTKPGGSNYVYRDFRFWTSGFFPGCLYLLLERRKKCPNQYDLYEQSLHISQLDFACNWWTLNLHRNATLEETHDLGFMIMPWARPAWELNRDTRALETLKTSAKTLVNRFSGAVGAIRSWDTCQTRRYNYQDPNTDFLMIIDNMMNLNLLFYVAQETNDNSMRDAAIQHARTTARTHVRSDSSTTHLVNFDPATGIVKERLTNQGFSHNSCWARGQAWAIAGFAETFHWTQDYSFLLTSRRCADYFLARLPESGIAPWDFDAHAQLSAIQKQPPDTSATLVAAYGMLLIHQALTARGDHSHYLSAALRMVEAVCSQHSNLPAKYTVEGELQFDTVENGHVKEPAKIGVDMGHADTIVNGATINNYEFAPRRWADHGLVYADYYFLLFGNELLKMNST